MNNQISKIAIGTAQFGLNYGINNKNGIPSEKNIAEILKFSYEQGINCLDTAAVYGNSEGRIGTLLKNSNLNFSIITKAEKNSNVKSITNSFFASKKRLNVNRIYGYLLHDFKDYQNDKNTINVLQELKEKNEVKKIGFSIYFPEQLEEILKDNISFDLLQIPYNLIDRRFEKYFYDLKERNIEIHIRSIFLQGLFFIHPDMLPNKLKAFNELLNRLNQYSKKYNKSLENIALNIALQNKSIDKVIIGIDNLEQLKSNIREAQNKLNEIEFKALKSEIDKCSIPIELLIPSNWN